MKVIRIFLAVLIGIIVGPVSWVAAWDAGSWFTVLLSLAIPSYGIIYWLLMELIGRIFLVHSFLSLALGFGGAYVSWITIVLLVNWEMVSKSTPLNDVEIIRSEIASELLENLAYKIVRESALSLTKDKESLKQALDVENPSTIILANIIITNAIQRELSTGRYHIYRGTLSTIGHDMLSQWDFAVNRLEELGEYTAEQANEDRRWLREQIKLVG